MLRKAIALFLVWCLLAPVGLLQAEPKIDPHFITKLGDKLPDKNYFFREFQLEGIRQVKDLTSMDSDMIIRTAPMSLKGFLPGWLQPGQMAYIVPEGQHPVIVFVDYLGGTSRIILNPGEAVIVDNRDPDLAEKQILAVIRCGNKVIDGSVKILPPETRIVEKEVKVEVEKIVQVPGLRGPQGPKGDKGDRGERGLPGMNAPKHSHKKLWAVIGGIAAAAVVGLVLKKSCCEPEPKKPDVHGNGNEL